VLVEATFSLRRFSLFLNNTKRRGSPRSLVLLRFALFFAQGYQDVIHDRMHLFLGRKRRQNI
jgi:hypothetical protein